jgi:glycosyltransferase involved in cell wall biosynthesis
MRIGIDYTPGIAQGAGIGRYARSLVAALAESNPQNEFVLFSSQAPGPERGFPSAANLRARAINFRGLPRVWHRLHLNLPVELFTGQIDIFHGLDYAVPPVRRARRIVTVHDIAFITHPEWAVPSLARYLSHVTADAARVADRVVADSQCTADDLVAWLDLAPGTVVVNHLGVDARYQPVDDKARLTTLNERYGLEHPLLLAVGTIEPRKNYPRLIEAFAMARHEPHGPRMLAIAGGDGWLYDETFHAVERHGVADMVRFLRYVPEADLPVLYSAADALVMPSLYEGFGLPVLEAMACGTPVVCSDGGSLREVAGEAALMISPTDVDSLAHALHRVTSDEGLRHDLRARGLKRAQGFTWEATARAQMEIYASVLDHR